MEPTESKAAPRQLRVMYLWTRLSGYMCACWRELSRRPGIEVRVCAFAITNDQAPFAEDRLTRGIDVVRVNQNTASATQDVRDHISDFKPDIVVVSGWVSDAYMTLAKERFGDAVYVMSLDTPYTGSFRQHLGRFRYPKYFRSIRSVIVTGERSHRLANLLGFSDRQVHRGVYGIDFDAQQCAHSLRTEGGSAWPKRFLSIGRASEEKGIDTLLEAYARYRASVDDPWPLTYCGTGPLSGQLEAAEGVDYRGFVQPGDLTSVQAQCGVFVLASRFDPWPLVISESCAAGLPIVSTVNCGSSVELVREYSNGITVAADASDCMADAMLWMHVNHDQLPSMGAASIEMARPYRAEAWADRNVAWFQQWTS